MPPSTFAALLGAALPERRETSWSPDGDMELPLIFNAVADSHELGVVRELKDEE
jgi:hypothetical protein